MNEQNIAELKEYRKSIVGHKCEVENCENKVEGYIRTHLVCKKHFKMFRTDNKKRIKLGIEINNILNKYK